MDGLEYRWDGRSTNPNVDNRRRGRFIAGGNDAALRNKAYDTLEVLYWQNLGYRLGKLLGPTRRETQIAMYDLCVRQQQERLADADT